MDKSPYKPINICVFCGSRAGTDPDFMEMAQDFGHEMAEADIGLVYGGGGIGLMGAISDSILAHGGQALGVIPEFLSAREISHQTADMIVVPDMHTRKRTMFEHADAFCVLPGGVGTLEEFLEIVTWRQLSVHNKPIILANWNGYWDNFVAMADSVRSGGFAYGPMEDLFTVVGDVASIIPTIQAELAVLLPDSSPGHPKLSET
jgi:uncharacterized protein (TIGR00730 family)